MTTHDAIKHLSQRIACAKQCDEKWADSVRIDALEIAVRAMAEEPKKGEWIKRTSLFQCSVCERFFTLKYNYCPNCGADMREETPDAEIH